MLMREGKVSINPGYDGVYGKIRIFPETEKSKNKKNIINQKTLL
jgi:PHP family Zn ribbon phosphoesterase